MVDEKINWFPFIPNRSAVSFINEILELARRSSLEVPLPRLYSVWSLQELSLVGFSTVNGLQGVRKLLAVLFHSKKVPVTSLSRALSRKRIAGPKTWMMNPRLSTDYRPGCSVMFRWAERWFPMPQLIFYWLQPLYNIARKQNFAKRGAGLWQKIFLHLNKRRWWSEIGHFMSILSILTECERTSTSPRVCFVFKLPAHWAHYKSLSQKCRANNFRRTVVRKGVPRLVVSWIHVKFAKMGVRVPEVTDF